MTARVKSRRKQKSVALSRNLTFGPRPILDGEDSDDYEEMLVGVSDALAPKDFIEEIWLHDLVNAEFRQLFYEIKNRTLSRQRHYRLPNLIQEIWGERKRKKKKWNNCWTLTLGLVWNNE